MAPTQIRRGPNTNQEAHLSTFIKCPNNGKN